MKSKIIIKTLIITIIIKFSFLNVYSISKSDVLYKNDEILCRNLNIEAITNILDLLTQEEILNIKHLYIFDCPINKLEGIEKFKNLESITIKNSNIEKIPDTNKFTKLKHLTLISNNISKIENLNLNITELTLANNKIEKMIGLEDLINLKKLILSGNQIKVIEFLDKLTNLETLNLISNNIANINGLKNLKNLKKIFLSENNIAKIEELDNLEKLGFLDLSNNKITSVENLSKLINLKQIDLSGNPIENISKTDYDFLQKVGLFAEDHQPNAIEILFGVHTGAIKLFEIDKSIKTKAKKFTSTVLDLRLRETEGQDGKIISSLTKGNKLEFLEKGKVEVINGVKGNWLKVRTEKGEEGWCFSGYLEEVKN
ncbi:MAG: leucine-rich repeat domain-containing protein [Candidatus Rickettsiella isopodorum]|nr:leucine-rich repeat domain-containing protein [Candidatus Rickettsiella isopodorum]